MKKLVLLACALLLGSATVVAQTTAISATVVDSDSTTWANGTWTIAFQPGPYDSNPAHYTIGGSPLSSSVAYQNGSANGSGVVSITVYRSTAISPIGSSWNFTMCPNASSPCATINFSTSASSVDISTQVNAAIAAPRFKAVPPAYGYNDSEAVVQLQPGNQYWNVTSGTTRCYSGSAWGVCSSGGTFSLTTTGTSGASTLTGAILNVPQYQGQLTLTTTGTSGAATLVSNTLNVPNYSASASGVQYNPTNTLYLWAGPDSVLGDDSHIHGTLIPAGSWSCTSGSTQVCTINTTSAHNLSVGEWFTTEAILTGWPGVPSPFAAWTSGYDLFQVATVPSSTQITFNTAWSSLSGASGSGGDIENANFLIPFYTASLPFFNGHGTTQTALPVNSTITSMVSNYSTVLHPIITNWISAHPGAPVYVFITGGRNDIQSCVSNSTLKSDLLSVASSVHTDGGQVIWASITPNPWNTTNLGCHTAFQAMLDLNNWAKTQLPTNANSGAQCTSGCGQYFDRVLDPYATINDLNNSYFYLTSGSNALTNSALIAYSQIINEEMSTQLSSYRGYPDNITSGVYGGTLAPGFGFAHLLTSTGKFAETWWDITGTSILFGIDGSNGPYLPALTSLSCLGTNSQGYFQSGSCGGTISGLTSGQVAIAGSATSITSSKALAGSGAGITTGPTSSTNTDIATFSGTAGQIQDSGTLLSSLAPLASPTFTGTPAAPTAVGGTNTTQLATTAFVQAAIAAAGTGAGIVTYSGPSITFSATQFIPIGGGAAASTTEANVDLDAPAAATIQNMSVQMSVAPGIGNSVVYTWRKNGTDTALTCTISGGSATACNDTTHSITVASSDLLAIKMVTTGTIVGTPTVVAAAQVGIGTSGSVSSFTGDGSLLSNSASTGPVTATLANAGANTVWGNQTGSPTTPSYGKVALASVATQAADTVVMNASGSTASPTATTMPTCTTGADLYNTSTHTWSCVSTGGGATTLYMIDDFTSGQIGSLGTTNNFSLNWTSAQAGASNSIITKQANTFPGHNGVIELNSGTSTNGWTMLGMGVSGNGVGPFDFDSATGKQTFTAEILVPLITIQSVRMGFTYRYAWFDTRYIDFSCSSSNAVPGDWYYETFDGTTTTSTDSGVSCNNVWHQLEISINNTAVTYYIDGTSVGTGTAPVTTGYVAAMGALSTTSSTNRVVDIDWAAISTRISNIQ